MEAAAFAKVAMFFFMKFQHTAAWRRLPPAIAITYAPVNVSTHSRVEAAAHYYSPVTFVVSVSTHSRVEAAASSTDSFARSNAGFNTQPRGGGC